MDSSKETGRIRREWPAEIEPGLIPTSNAMGIMTREPAPVALKFADHASRARYPSSKLAQLTAMRLTRPWRQAVR